MREKGRKQIDKKEIFFYY